MPNTHTSQDFSRLRARFESSKLLVDRARERASRAAEMARAMRTLLETRHGLHIRSGAPHADIWEAAAYELSRAARERDMAFGVLSHELRQSLSAALTAERLLAASDTATAARARQVLARQLQHLSKLVDSMLDLSRLTLRGAGFAQDDFDVRSVVRQAVEGNEAAAAEKKHRVEVDLSSEPQIVRGDPTRLLQVFSNLLQNAVRYTPAGGHIRVTCEASNDWVEIVVADNGSGIPADAQSAIFEPFRRLTTHGEGLGIGLALALRIVDLHGGRLSVTSAGQDCGSAFTVLLPRTPDVAQRPDSPKGH